uniref:Uncharacterized protein n=1 Tax=Meloidogyne enterolobii TaxID=390850 RepID=A0A6V7V6P7_MELEN|nr:unnamed protein product [Meloidogyne enterolobii]
MWKPRNYNRTLPLLFGDCVFNIKCRNSLLLGHIGNNASCGFKEATKLRNDCASCRRNGCVVLYLIEV